jgi:hypothetical protein
MRIKTVRFAKAYGNPQVMKICQKAHILVQALQQSISFFKSVKAPALFLEKLMHKNGKK